MSESCGNPAADSEALMPRKLMYDKSRMCVKCKEAEGNIVIRHAVYCKACFAPLIEVRFRRTFEPHINRIPDGPRKSALRPAGDLLLGYSGGLGSTVLLDLMHRRYLCKTPSGAKESGGKAHPRNERVWTSIRVCYVEICDAFPGMRDRTEEVKSAVNQYKGFDFIPLRIQDTFDRTWWESVTGQPIPPDLDVDIDISDENLCASSSSTDASPLSRLQTYLRLLPTPTAVAASITTWTRLLLLYTAYSTGTSHLALGTSLTSLSIALISSISQGGGFTVPQEAQEEWTPFHSTPIPFDKPWAGDVRIVRPLREIGMKECAAWAWWHGLNVVGKERLPATRQTIGGLTKDFIVGLEKDYPSTVSTISRTASKLAPKDAPQKRCILCEKTAQGNVQEWKSRISIRSLTGDQSPHHDKDGRSLIPLLCYHCHTTLTSRSSRSSLPSTSADSSTDIPRIPLPIWVSWHLSNRPAEASEKSSVDAYLETLDDEIWERKSLDEKTKKTMISESLLEE